MGRRIVSEQLESGVPANIPPDDYAGRLIKYIPTEGVGFWLAVSGIIQSAGNDVPKEGLLWLFFVIGLIVTFGWIRRQTKEPGKPTAWTHIFLSCGAFIVWVFAAGGPFETSWPSWYKPLYGSLLLITYTALVGFVVPPET
jgi:hypothetical protein